MKTMSNVTSCRILPFALLLIVLQQECSTFVDSFDMQQQSPSQSPQFPASTRAALKLKANVLNKDTTAYSAAGWSNRAAVALTPVHPAGVYTADRPFYWNGIDVSCRCTIIELPSKSKTTSPDLWVHSPVALDGPLRQALQRTGGTVRYVVSPNYEHLKFAPQWQQAYADAQMWACPGLTERMPSVSFAGEIPNHYRPEVSWTASSISRASSRTSILPWDTSILQSLHIDCERNPFTGTPFFNEVIFYHAPTKCLVVTDLFWNYPANNVPNSQFGRDDSWELAPADIAPVPLPSLLWKFGMDKVYAPFFQNYMVKDQKAYREIAHHIVHVWDVEILIPAHGDILRGKEFISTVLKMHFGLD
jgi:hypothetical protein